MSQLERLKASTTLSDVAIILGFQPKSLAYILYKKPSVQKYHHFEIPKRSGGKRSISAPLTSLKLLQKRLSKLLHNCISEINIARGIESSLSHGFRRKHSIITNATCHRNKRYVFNIDLHNFFGTINFGRVRGFFISNRNFELNPKVATVLAQIACEDNALPQGSPCSPVISNLIGHLLDIRIVKLSSQLGCSYSRYADDLTFSTNKLDFPIEIAERTAGNNSRWQVGHALESVVVKTGFTINETKTRMQFMTSRQDVTGLVVNSKVNTRSEYRHMARAMVHRLLATGSHQRKEYVEDGGNIVEKEVEGSINQLNGMLSFIDSITVFNKKKSMGEQGGEKYLKMSEFPECCEKVYKNFLFYKNFHALDKALIICEGKTDSIYLEAALQKLANAHPELIETKKDGSLKKKIRFFHRSPTTGRILGLAGGAGEFNKFITTFFIESNKIAALGKNHPVILFIDNDDGAKGIYGHISNITKSAVSREDSFIYVKENLYVIPTPLTHDKKDTMIEDFFEPQLKSTQLNGKSFNPSKKGFSAKTEYGKNHFAKYVVKANKTSINFNNFDPIFGRIEQVLAHYSK